MRLITIFELATKTDNELRVLCREVFNETARGNRASQERHNALASLENIRRVMISRARSR